MKEIKRYNLDPTITKGDCEVKLNLTEDKTYGYYVKYTNHKEVVETMQKRIDELESILDNIQKQDYP